VWLSEESCHTLWYVYSPCNIASPLNHGQGKWWFGSRSKTKDGVQANTASIFFKDIAEETTHSVLVATISKGCESEKPQILTAIKHDAEVESLTRLVSESLGTPAPSIFGNLKSPGSKLAFTLLYAHLARISVSSPALQDCWSFLTPTCVC
jgi:translocation protein SEC63